jgi:hypothetical protein
VLGVLEDGIAPDLDMVMVELAMPEFDRTGGVWQGMSGSPVYADDGRLIGAVAYGLAWGASPIAGITPFEDMDDYLGTEPPGRVALKGAAARTVAARAGISTSQAQQGFEELPMPLGVSGVTARRLAQARSAGPDFLEQSTYVLGRAGRATDVGAETMVAGGNMAASVAYGDVSMAGVGTATSVCGDRVVGFGHPLALLGATTEALHTAEAVYVQPDSLGVPFKVANLGPAVGTVADDRLTGITGTFGAAPEASTITSSVTYGARTRTGSTAVSVPDFAAEATFYQLIANQDRVLDGPSRGTEVLAWTITGTEDGRPFSLSFTDRYTGTDLSWEAPNGVAELVWYLAALEGVEVGSVTANATVTDSLARHTLGAIEQLRGGKWVPVTQKAPAQAKAGGTVRLRVQLAGTAGRRTVALAPIALPKRAGGKLVLLAQGGDGMWSSVDGSTVAKVRAALAEQLRHDQVRVQVGTPRQIGYGGGEEEEFYRRPAKPAQFVRTRTTAPLPHVVSGSKMLRVVVR